jgi:DNA-binding Lrp family transcriptional regulator
MEALSKQDHGLLVRLQTNAKFDINDLMADLNMSRTSVYERIKKLEQEGYITGYVALVDKKKVGLDLTVICTVSLNSQRAECVKEFNEAVIMLEEVIECYVTGGIFDYILKIVVRDLDEYSQFVTHKLSIIPHVSTVKSSFVLNCVKASSILPIK